MTKRVFGGERPSRVAPDGGARGNILGDHRAGADQRAAADGDAAEDRGVASDGYLALDHRGQFPPLGGDRLAVDAGARVLFVGEHDAVADEAIIADGDAGTDETMGGNLAPATDLRAALDLHEGADLAPVADLAAIQIDKTMDLDVLAQLYVAGNQLIISHRYVSPTGLGLLADPAWLWSSATAHA